MHNCISVFKKALFLAALFVLPCTMTNCATRPASIDSYHILPQDADDPQDVRWSDYLYDHLKKRLSGGLALFKTKTDDGYNVYVDYDAQMGTDYSVQNLDDGILLKARDSEKIVWLIYEFISNIGQKNKDISVSDLPPAQIDLDENVEGNFAFEYRGLYTPHCNDADLLGIYGVHNVDFDWAVWGHNLSKILSNKSASDLYAHSASAEAGAQFCFTSESLFKQIEAYIMENYGNGEKGSARFAILPNDNDIVCLCGNCTKEGNTAGNASPAVASLVTRLAQRFPKHLFFMSAYRTTRQVPPYPMADNVGVLLSSIDFPMKSPDETDPTIKKFTQTIKDWKKLVSRVYVWDYMRDYDDYLTPYPCLGVLQKRLQYYKRHGVDGVFFNGSGYDYASFDGMQTYALAALMKNPDMDIKELASNYFSVLYPTAHKSMESYYLGLEDKASASKEALPLYGGMDDSKRIFLDKDDFCEFYDGLPKLIDAADDEEKDRLSKLYTALSYSRLELARASDKDAASTDINNWLEQLSLFKQYEDMTHYREAKGDVSSYLQEWRDLMASGGVSNRLKGQTLTIQGTSDFTKEQARLLTDGRMGFVTDYHTGWLITKAREWGVDLPANIPEGGTLELSFLHAPTWHIYAPLKVNVYADGTLLFSVTVPDAEGETDFQRARCTVRLDAVGSGKQVRVMFVRADDDGIKTACDEIVLN